MTHLLSVDSRPLQEIGEPTPLAELLAPGWEVGRDASDGDRQVVVDGVLRHGRALAAAGHARPLSCLLRHEGKVVAGAVGRTEFGRLFVHSLWVHESLRGRGLGTLALCQIEQAAAADGCADALIETLDGRTARLYERLGYVPLAFVARYVGPFDRHILLKRFTEGPP